MSNVLRQAACCGNRVTTGKPILIDPPRRAAVALPVAASLTGCKSGKPACNILFR